MRTGTDRVLTSALPGQLRLRNAWADASALNRYLAMTGALLAIVLLGGFYAVVSAAAHRAESAREQSKVALDRQVVCSAFSASSSRELCLLTMATHVPQNAVVSASYERPRAPLRRPQLTAGL